MGSAEHRSCIARPKEDEKHKSWCGRQIGCEFHLMGLDHAACLQQSRLQPCEECVRAACAELRRLAE